MLRVKVARIVRVVVWMPCVSVPCVVCGVDVGVHCVRGECCGCLVCVCVVRNVGGARNDVLVVCVRAVRRALWRCVDVAVGPLLVLSFLWLKVLLRLVLCLWLSLLVWWCGC